MVIFFLFNVVLICVGKVTKNIQIMAHFDIKKKTDSTLMMLSVRWRDVSFCSDDDRPVAQARGGADGRQEGRERGY